MALNGIDMMPKHCLFMFGSAYTQPQPLSSIRLSPPYRTMLGQAFRSTSGVNLPSIRSLFPDIDFRSAAELGFTTSYLPQVPVDLPSIQTDDDEIPFESNEDESESDEDDFESDEQESGSDDNENDFRFGEEENEWDIDPVPLYISAPHYTEFVLS